MTFAEWLREVEEHFGVHQPPPGYVAAIEYAEREIAEALDKLKKEQGDEAYG